MGIDDSLAEGLPEPAARALREWAVQSGKSYTLSRWYVAGRSGAIVCAVRERRPYEDDRKIILKLDTISDPARIRGEYARQLDAVHDAPAGFAAAHLVRPVPEPVRAGDGYWFSFQELATGAPTDLGLADLRALSSLLDQVRGAVQPDRPQIPCDGETFAATCAAIVGSVLGDWARPRRTQELSVHEYLERHLRHRLTPDGELARLAAGLPDLWLAVPYEPTPLPNPLALATRPELTTGQWVPALIGRAHGDLHEDNILVPVHPRVDADGYRLIDLSKYRPDAPLAHDPVHFVLHMVTRSLPDLSHPQRQALIEVLLEPGSGRADQLPGWLASVVRQVRAATEAWAGSLVEEWRAQLPLSLLACALIYLVRRTTPTDARDWFLWLAARAAGEHARRSGSLPVESAGPATRSPTGVTAGVTAGPARESATSAQSGHDWVARLCTSLPDLRGCVEDPTLRPRLTTLVSAALSAGESGADWEQQLDQLMWESGVDSPRIAIPGAAPGQAVAAERYRCPVGRCPRSEVRAPSGRVPYCHLARTALHRDPG